MNEMETEFIENIESNVTVIKVLLTDLLDYSSLNTAERKVEKLDMEKMLNDLVQDYEENLDKVDAKISLTDFPEEVVADKDRLKNLLQRLILSGLRYSGISAQPAVEIRCIEKGGYWQFQIKHKDLNVKTADDNQAFTKFALGLSDDNNFDGNNLELAICKKIVDQHDGHLLMESNEDEGSEYIFTISRMLNQTINN